MDAAPASNATLVDFPRATSPATLLVEPRRIAWVHIPKCGTSFGNTLVHWANLSLPADATVGTDAREFMTGYAPRRWFFDQGNIFWMKDGNFGNHNSILAHVYRTWRGRFVGMFRSPAQRAESAYRHFGSHVSKAEYALRIRGSATTMLAGQSYGLNCVWPKRFNCSKVTPNIDLALARLSGFAFVGLTELYDLSVCLFHVMFHGPCLPVEFSNTRPAAAHGRVPDEYTAWSPWGGIIDGDDWRLYAEATRMFWAALHTYRVNELVCQRVCPLAGDRFAAYRDLFRRL